jgi:biopolymer transport protein ExbB
VNAYKRFFGVIRDNRNKPAWWVESRAGDEAGDIEKILSRGLWILETVVTGAPLMGLLGTITGMMQAFKVIGGSGLVAPTQVTSGVTQALIATALGLLIALFALFGFNFFARMQSQALDHLERLGSRLIDHIRLDEETDAGYRRGRIEIIPMIDVMFFLLVTFMWRRSQPSQVGGAGAAINLAR